MTLPLSGVMTASMINVELGRASNASFAIGGSEERALAGVPSGTIKFSDFYGKASTSWAKISWTSTHPLNVAVTNDGKYAATEVGSGGAVSPKVYYSSNATAWNEWFSFANNYNSYRVAMTNAGAMVACGDYGSIYYASTFLGTATVKSAGVGNVNYANGVDIYPGEDLAFVSMDDATTQTTNVITMSTGAITAPVNSVANATRLSNTYNVGANPNSKALIVGLGYDSTNAAIVDATGTAILKITIGAVGSSPRACAWVPTLGGWLVYGGGGTDFYKVTEAGVVTLLTGFPSKYTRDMCYDAVYDKVWFATSTGLANAPANDLTNWTWEELPAGSSVNIGSIDVKGDTRAATVASPTDLYLYVWK